MRTYAELFNECLQQFIDENESIYRKICDEAFMHSSNTGTPQEHVIDGKIKKAFIAHLHTRYGNNINIFTTVITLLAHDESERTQILTDHYTKIAESIGSPLDDFLKQNNITI
nr:hypothetical protein [Providencia alcalifaciens]